MQQFAAFPVYCKIGGWTMENYYVEKERKLEIENGFDIVVAGGGTAGVVAAIAAARSGKKVLIVEQFGALGGSASMGLVTPLMNTGIAGNPMCSSISDEINNRMMKSGYCYEDIYNNKGHFDPVMLRFILEDMAVEAGAGLLYYTFLCGPYMEDGVVKGVVVENKKGRYAIAASRVIDCTGDGDIARRAGVTVDSGNPETGKNQPMSVRYTVSGVNVEKFSDFLRGFGSRHILPLVNAAVVWGKNLPLEGLFKKALERGDITYEDGVYWQVDNLPGKPDAMTFNCPEILNGVDGTNPVDLTNAQVYAKKAIMRQVTFYKKYLPGFENCYITEVAPMVGIRESRRIKGMYELTTEDVVLCRKFGDHIAKSNYPVDIHGYKSLCEHIDMNGKDPVPYYEIPYRCLVPVNIKGLIVAGRCISASFVAQSTLRIQPTVRAIGEAAGIAAAMSIDNNSWFDEIDGAVVRSEMIRRGARF
jgi:Dehydrogenases (flavoproteins)